MSAEDVARALMAMDDRALRARVADGDLAAVGADALPENEQQLLAAAASAVPGDDEIEVAGHSMISYAPPYVTVGPVGSGQPLQVAMRYAQDGISDRALATTFHAWSVNVSAQGSW
jgi:hypothetical protein